MIRILAAALCLSFAAPALASAQQERMKTCNQKATGMKGDERKEFMSKCLKGEGEAKPNPQQLKMRECNKQAAGKKGEERKTFMSDCLKSK